MCSSEPVYYTKVGNDFFTVLQTGYIHEAMLFHSAMIVKSVKKITARS